MKLQPDKSDVQTLTAHGPGWVAINNERVESSVVVGSRGERFEWDASDFSQIGAEHFAKLAGLGAELIIFGSGKRIRFPQPAWLQPLMAQRTGVETMDTPAACRTYNILASEGRHVLAALLIEKPEGQ
ncbi:Mth938-like domain-containing protein [Variovorax saccharolyticus]|uniref:Mth938-like domain-containing protein n=1 Tax=Variovorax saccharolyticus TaxID=3053516 RepID=UPI002574C08A|nr:MULTISPECIES: Mth938-like domain-containing protein [unclassified Variovorax]MDM0016576.1 Mth938-like domain-containing protein [Variovorax sp. J22R187]MDM0023123.1 Mth938-like domain-containing protein [Variovorax sp. J31P216]